MADCLVCPPDRKRLPRRGQVCDPCRSRLAFQLAEIPELVVELADRQLEHGAHSSDPVAAQLPAASIASRAKAQRVSGSKERSAPVSLDAVDLTARMRAGLVADPFHDQIGEQPAATILDAWVRDLRRHRGGTESLPVAHTLPLACWVLDRLSDACDDYPAIGDMATEVRRLRSSLRAQLGLVGFDDELKDGVQCPKCDTRAALHQANGSDRIECGSCSVLLSVDEYNEWTKLLVSGLEWMRGRRCEACGLVNRLYRVRGGDGSVLCGWCHISNMNGGVSAEAR